LALSSSVRIRVFDIGTDRGVGNELCVIYDAKNIGSEVYANDVGSAFWTMPIDHPLIPYLVPLKRHYKIERKSGNNWVLIGAGIISAYDATNDEIVYEGMDYMTMMSMHYTALVGPQAGSETAIIRAEPEAVTETVGPVTITASRSASVLDDGTADPKLWNSNDTEKHIPLGSMFSTFNIVSYYISSNVADILVNSNTFSLLSVGDVIYITGGGSRLNGARTISTLSTISSTSGRVTFSSSGANVTSTTLSGAYMYFPRYRSRGFVKFDLPSNLTNDSTVSQADLVLYQTNESGDHTLPDTSPGDLRIQRVDVNDWTTESAKGYEGGWENAGNTLDWSTMSTDVAGTEYSYNSHTNVHLTKLTTGITGILDYWKVNSASRNKGIRLKNTDETVITNGFTIASTKYSAAYRPALILTYTAVSNPATNINVNGLEKGPKATKTLLSQRSANSYARHDGKEIAVYCKNEAGDPNELDVSYDETTQTYTLSGRVYIERSAIDNDQKLYDAETDDYIPNRFNIESIKLAISASPGGEICTINVWPGSWAQLGTPETPAQIKWQLKLRQHDSTEAEVIAPGTEPTSSLTTSGGVYGNFTSGVENITNSYEINCLTSGIQYDFNAFPMVEIAVVSPQTSSTSPDYGGSGAIHDVNGVLASTDPNDSAIMGLKKETLQDIISGQVTELDTQGGSYSRFGWITSELASGQSYGSGLIRYFTSGQSVLEFLRDMCDKEMAANLLTPDDANRRWDTIDDIKIPWRSVFNFVGIRGAGAPGTKLYVAPAKSDSSPQYLLDYPGNIDVFRYRRDGKKLRNHIRVVPSTAFLTGSTTVSSGSRSQGKFAENQSSIQEYGYAPILSTQANFADEEELQKYADSQLIKMSDILNVSMSSIQIAPDSVRPFEDFYLGDVIQVAIRRKNVNFSDPVQPDLMTDAYVVGGVRFELPVDGSERITLDLVKASDFGRG
jgi:hypothetical protein